MTKKHETVQSCKPGCRYAGKFDGEPCCDYLLITDRKRPCPGGPDCTAWAPSDGAAPKKPKPITIGGGKKRGRSRNWDTARARELYDAGMSQSQIAKAIGVSYKAVALWQKAEGLPPNGLRQKSAEPKIAEPKIKKAPADISPDPEPGLSIRLSTGAVTVEICGETVKGALELLDVLRSMLLAPASKEEKP